MERFDVAVVGAGAAGSAAARSIVEAGRSCVVLERFPLGHAEGSSHGSARIFRLAYHHPDYVRMALHARDAWRELESASGTRSEEHTSELQSQSNLVCRLLLEKKKKKKNKRNQQRNNSH